MNDILERYTKLKKRADEAQQKADKAEGALSQILSQLKSEFGCDSLKAANIKLQKLKKEEEKLTEQFEESLNEFEKKWSVLSE